MSTNGKHKTPYEEKFADLTALTQQITADVANARAYFAQRGAMHASGQAGAQARR